MLRIIYLSYVALMLLGCTFEDASTEIPSLSRELDAIVIGINVKPSSQRLVIFSKSSLSTVGYDYQGKDNVQKVSDKLGYVAAKFGYSRFGGLISDGGVVFRNICHKNTSNRYITLVKVNQESIRLQITSQTREYSACAIGGKAK